MYRGVPSEKAQRIAAVRAADAARRVVKAAYDRARREVSVAGTFAIAGGGGGGGSGALLHAAQVGLGTAGVSEGQTLLVGAMSAQARGRDLATQSRKRRRISAAARLGRPADPFFRGRLRQRSHPLFPVANFYPPGGVPGYCDPYYRGAWHVCDQLFEEDCMHGEDQGYVEATMRVYQPKSLAWKLIDEFRRSANRSTASSVASSVAPSQPPWRPSLFIFNEDDRASCCDSRSADGDVADMDMAAFGDVDMDKAASSRTSSSRASSGRSSFAFLRTGSIPSGGSSLSFLRAHHMSVDDRDSTPSDHMRSGDVNDSMPAWSHYLWRCLLSMQLSNAAFYVVLRCSRVIHSIPSRH